MTPVRPEFVPDASLSREEMEALQRDIADAAVFADDLPFDPATITEGPLATAGQEPPVVVGVDQAFLDERAVSAVVALRGGEVIERAYAATPLEIPYIPGLLSFREGRSILAAFEELSVTPDLALFDGSGRIHFRQAGLATHIGVTLDLPSVGVAKSLLCGTPRGPVDGLPEGTRVAVEADGNVDAPDGTVVGYAVQSRQYESGNASINPLYVSPGHRVSAETAADFVEGVGGEYKLPEPTRLADKYADEVKDEVR
ncbi:endonuclease V [Halostella sp. PRR32]|uniref:endonuclease V n=1 Tax=Halostella sp. PRR32 TaxID=3098147 RepID=UPI00110F631C|nr:endonuclease V [Halostella sp. PRR32]